MNLNIKSIISLPFDVPEYLNEKVSNFEKWALDRQPPAIMRKELPPIFVTNVKNAKDPLDAYKKVRSELLHDVPPCPSDAEIVSLITTARNSFASRDLYRIYAKVTQNKIPIRFLIGHIGENESPEVTKRINEEIKQNGDFIIGGYEDKYDNLSFKVKSRL